MKEDSVVLAIFVFGAACLGLMAGIGIGEKLAPSEPLCPCCDCSALPGDEICSVEKCCQRAVEDCEKSCCESSDDHPATCDDASEPNQPTCCKPVKDCRRKVLQKLR